jgi:hypothetical protein
MKLSEFALTVLKNFSTINDGIALRPGSKIKTINEEESIFAEAEVDDVFPVEFGIDDLNNFLGNITTLGNANLDFNGNSVLLSEGGFSLTYRATPLDLITVVPVGKKVKLDNPDVTFDLPKETLAKLLKLAAMNSLSNLSVIGFGGELRLQTHDKSDRESTAAFTPVGAYAGEDFTATFKTEHLKMLPDDYVVDLKKGIFARFTSKTRKLIYYIALEAK